MPTRTSSSQKEHSMAAIFEGIREDYKSLPRKILFQ